MANNRPADDPGVKEGNEESTNVLGQGAAQGIAPPGELLMPLMQVPSPVTAENDFSPISYAVFSCN